MRAQRGGAAGFGRAQTSEKDSRRLDKFGGAWWESWGYQFKVILNGVSTRAHRVVEVRPDEVQDDEADAESIECMAASL